MTCVPEDGSLDSLSSSPLWHIPLPPKFVVLKMDRWSARQAVHRESGMFHMFVFLCCTLACSDRFPQENW